MTQQQVLFLQLVRSGIGHSVAPLHGNPNWNEIKVLADQHGLKAIVLDGLNRIFQNFNKEAVPEIRQDLLLAWMGEVINCEQQYHNYKLKISELAKFYDAHGLRMMILKGYGLSLNYPIPCHRPIGDVDIWLFGEYKEADKILYKELSIKVRKDEPHHTVFMWEGYPVENHFDFLIVNTNNTNAKLERILKRLAKERCEEIDIEGQMAFLPSSDFNALFLLRHMLMHFVAIGISLRLLLDWAFFWERNKQNVNWNRLLLILEEYKMMDFFHIINLICIEELGFDKDIFPATESSKEFMKNKVLDDIISPKYDWKDVYQLHMFPRIIFKYRRWISNKWKRKLCYKEGNVLTLLYGIRAHLLKPSTI